MARPDPKQEYVTQWQSDFNKLEPDVRCDAEAQNELYQRIIDLQDQLFEISDERKVDAEQERVANMTSSWLSDKLHLVTNHYINLTRQEIMKTSVRAAVLRKHYAFQAEMAGECGPFKKEVFSPKVVPDPVFEIEIETEELADSEDVVSLGDLTAKINATYDSYLSCLDNLLNYENAIVAEVKYTPPKSTEEVKDPPKSPKGKGKKSPKPKSAGKKGKKSATPVEEKSVANPDLVAKQERGEKCREEAKEGIKLLIENGKRRLRHIKHVLTGATTDIRDRFEQTFKVMFDIIGSQFNNEIVATEQLVQVVQSAIENSSPLNEPLYLENFFVVDENLRLESSKSMPPKTPPTLATSLEMSYANLKETMTDSQGQAIMLPIEDIQLLASDLGVATTQLLDYAGGDWRVVLLASSQLEPSIENEIRKIAENSTMDVSCLIQRSLWESLMPDDSQFKRFGWEFFSAGQTLPLRKIIEILDLRVDRPTCPSSQSFAKSLAAESLGSMPENVFSK